MDGRTHRLDHGFLLIAVAVATRSDLSWFGLARGIALDHAGDLIRCNTLSPGGIATAGMAAFYGSLENADRKWGAPMHPLGRLGRVEEIADAAVFLASDESGFMTGADLPVDGGYTSR